MSNAIIDGSETSEISDTYSSFLHIRKIPSFDKNSTISTNTVKYNSDFVGQTDANVENEEGNQSLTSSNSDTEEQMYLLESSLSNVGSNLKLPINAFVMSKSIGQQASIDDKNKDNNKSNFSSNSKAMHNKNEQNNVNNKSNAPDESKQDKTMNNAKQKNSQNPKTRHNFDIYRKALREYMVGHPLDVDELLALENIVVANQMLSACRSN